MKYIFIHGLGQDAASWEETITAIGAPIDGVCLQLSQILQGEEVTYSNLYKAVSAYCNGIAEPIHLCGLSLGAILALNYTLDHPQKVKTLMLIGCQYKMPKGLLKMQNLIFRCLPSKVFEGIGFGKKDFIGLTKSMMALDFTKELGNISCPTVLVCGDKDKANKKASKDLAQAIEGAKLHMIEGAGHEVNTQTPQALAQVIKECYKLG